MVIYRWEGEKKKKQNWTFQLTFSGVCDFWYFMSDFLPGGCSGDFTHTGTGTALKQTCVLVGTS